MCEVQIYFAEREASADEAARFFNHYASRGWLVSSDSKMKSWNAAARNWLSRIQKLSKMTA